MTTRKTRVNPSVPSVPTLVHPNHKWTPCTVMHQPVCCRHGIGCHKKGSPDRGLSSPTSDHHTVCKTQTAARAVHTKTSQAKPSLKRNSFIIFISKILHTSGSPDKNRSDCIAGLYLANFSGKKRLNGSDRPRVILASASANIEPNRHKLPQSAVQCTHCEHDL